MPSNLKLIAFKCFLFRNTKTPASNLQSKHKNLIKTLSSTNLEKGFKQQKPSEFSMIVTKNDPDQAVASYYQVRIDQSEQRI